MEIDQKLQDDLVEALFKVSIVKSYDGRSSLIPEKARGLNRSHENDEADLALIVRQLKELIWEGEQVEWALLVFIDSAYSRVKGTTLGTDLKGLREQCLEYLERERLKSEPAFPSTLPPEQHPPSDSSTEPPSTFFQKASSYVTVALNGVKAASKPFKELSIGKAEPVECREAINQLTTVILQLTELLELLEVTSPLPSKTIAPYRRQYIEQAQYLIEQSQILLEWIAESRTANKNIKRKFFILDQALCMFAIFNQHEGSDGDSED